MLIEVGLRPLRARLQLGRWHLRTWPRFLMTSPRGYVEPFVVYAVELTDDTGARCLGQVAAFTSEAEAARLLARVTARGALARINLIAVHRALDYEHDR